MTSGELTSWLLLPKVLQELTNCQIDALVLGWSDFGRPAAMLGGSLSRYFPCRLKEVTSLFKESDLLVKLLQDVLRLDTVLQGTIRSVPRLV